MFYSRIGDEGEISFSKSWQESCSIAAEDSSKSVASATSRGICRNTQAAAAAARNKVTRRKPEKRKRSNDGQKVESLENELSARSGGRLKECSAAPRAGQLA